MLLTILDTAKHLIDTAHKIAVSTPTLKEVVQDVAKPESSTYDNIMDVLKVLSGGLFGALVTNFFNKRSNKIQKMYCYYIDDDVKSQMPVQTAAGQHQNYHFKEFLLENNTNKDISEFKIIFEFDAQSSIIAKHSICKEGYDVLKCKQSKKNNECIFVIKHFNRKDKVTFQFEIADILNNVCNITEAGVTGFKIHVKDRRKPKKPAEIKIVDKSKIV